MISCRALTAFPYGRSAFRLAFSTVALQLRPDASMYSCRVIPQRRRLPGTLLGDQSVSEVNRAAADSMGTRLPGSTTTMSTEVSETAVQSTSFMSFRVWLTR